MPKLINYLPLKFALLLGIMANLCQGLVGDWQSFTYLNHVTAIEAFNGKIFVGTTGGIREYNPKNKTEVVHNNPQLGILDIEIAGFTITDDNHLWAISKKGILYKWDQSNSWETFNRNFSSYAGTINNRAVLSVGSYIVLGSSKGLSFFLAKPLAGEPAGIFYETFYAFGTEKDLSVTSLLRKGDDLYIGTTKGVFTATLYWDNLKNPPASFVEEHGRFLNPQIWSKVEIDSTSSLISQAELGPLNIVDNKINAFGPGTVLQDQESSRAILGENVRVKGKIIPGSTDMITLEILEDKIFTGSSSGFYEFHNDKYHLRSNTVSLPKGDIFNVAANEYGTHIWSVDLGGELLGPSSLFKIENNQWVNKYNFTLPQIIGALKHRLNVMYSRGENEVYIGNWGWGVERVTNGTTTFVNSSNSCLEGVVNSPDYTVIRNVTPYKDEGLFITAYHVVGSFSLSYIKFNTHEDDPLKVTCFNSNLFYNPEANISQDIKIIDDEYLLVSTQLSLEIFRIEDLMSSNGLKPIKYLEAPTSGLKNIRASNVDEYDRLWVATNGEFYTADKGHLLNYDEEGRLIKDSLLFVEDLPAVECNYLKKDDIGNLWAGCINGLIKITPGEESPVASYKIYSTQDGLLDDDIIHLDIDHSTGTIWSVTSKGLNSLEAGSTIPISKLKEVNVFPNPFLKKHEYVVFTDLTPTSNVRIMNQGGHVLFESDDSQIVGGQLKWKGENKAGRKVSQGVYFYSVIDKGKIVKGKLIISR